nr:hypothetical protein [uncultured Allomuricauda sp.]
MGAEKIVLKESPPLEFIFDENSFQIINAANPDSEGIYEHATLKSVGFHKEKTNWFLTIFSFMVELVVGVGGGDRYKDKKKLTIHHANKKVKIDLFDCEQKTIDKLISKLKAIANLTP